MRFLTTTQPPAGILDHDLGIEWAPPVFFRRDPGSPAEAAATVMAQILDRIGEGHRAVTLRDWCNDAVRPVTTDREWWQDATDQLAKQIAGAQPDLDAIAVDHPRYPGRRTEAETDWLADCMAELVPLVDRFGVYGVPGISPTVWTGADEFRWRDDHNQFELAWTIMPGQHRNNAPPPTVLEFAGVIEAIRSRGMDTCIVWSDPGVDGFGRWKTRPDHWHALLTVAALARGRRVEVPRWEPPSWLPPADAMPMKAPPRSGPSTTKVFSAAIEEVQP